MTYHLGMNANEDKFIEDEQEDEDDPLDEVIRAKWVMDGASTLSEAAENLRAFAAYLEGMEKEGWQLTAPVADDYGFIRQA